MSIAPLPSRQDVAVDDTWDLTAIYPDRDAWLAAIAGVRDDLPALGAAAGTLGSGPQALLDILRLENGIGERLNRIFAWAGLQKDQDNADNEAVVAFDQAVQLSVACAQAASYIEPELLALPDGTVESYLATEPQLAMYQQALDDLLRQRAHVLDAATERILAAAGEVMSAPGQIFTMLNNADLTYGTITDEDGNEVELTKGNAIRFLESQNRSVRQAAFEGLHRVYQQHRNTLATTYSHAIKAGVFNARERHYDSALQAALQPNNIPLAVYDTLLEVVHRRLPSLHRYIDLRRRVLGLEKLQAYDLYVPIVPEVTTEYTWDRGVQMVLDSLTPLGEDYLQHLSAAMDSRWVDIYENRGKTSGAYSWGVYGVHPYILMNWAGRLDDVFTLGHEVGHAMHSTLTFEHQPYIYSRYALFVAEVASTVNESLMNAALRRDTDDPALKAYLLNHALEDFRTTFFRQAMFSEFERWTHAQVEAGAGLTADNLSAQYAALCAAYYGPSVEISEYAAIEWSRVPHFYRPFYVFQYATGLSAAVTLSQMLLDEGEEARERYLTFLSGGSSKYPLELLRDAGVDMATPDPIERAMDTFDALLTELEALLDASDAAGESANA